MLCSEQISFEFCDNRFLLLILYALSTFAYIELIINSDKNWQQKNVIYYVTSEKVGNIIVTNNNMLKTKNEKRKKKAYIIV